MGRYIAFVFPSDPLDDGARPNGGWGDVVKVGPRRATSSDDLRFLFSLAMSQAQDRTVQFHADHEAQIVDLTTLEVVQQGTTRTR